ncbi:MAG: hypothetical protein ABI255_08455 [Microbacteriaceae bacterium]
MTYAVLALFLNEEKDYGAVTVESTRHLWQTAMRGYGGDWSFSQYFVFYYLSWGKLFRSRDVFAGNLLGAIEAIDSGVTTTLDWSHGLQTTEHAEAAIEALKEVPGRFVLGYGNLLGEPWEWATAPEFRSFVERNRLSAHVDGRRGLGAGYDAGTAAGRTHHQPVYLHGVGRRRSVGARQRVKPRIGLRLPGASRGGRIC